MKPTKEEIEALAAGIADERFVEIPLRLEAADRRIIAAALRLLAASVEAKPAEWRVIYRYGRNQPMPEGHTVNIGNIQDAKQLPTGDGYEVTPLFLASPSHASGVAEGIERAAAWHDAQAAEYAAVPGPFQNDDRIQAAGHRHHAARLRALKEGK